MKSTMLLVVFVILGLLGANAVIDCGLLFGQEAPDSGIRSSWHEYLLVFSLIISFLLLGLFGWDSRPIGVAMSLITMAAFWVCVRLGWMLLGHGHLMSTGDAGLLIPSQMEGLIWVYLNLLSNLFLLFAGLYTLSDLGRLGTLGFAGFCGLLYLVWKWCWPMAIVMTVVIIFFIIRTLSLGMRKLLKLIGKSKNQEIGPREEMITDDQPGVTS